MPFLFPFSTIILQPWYASTTASFPFVFIPTMGLFAVLSIGLFSSRRRRRCRLHYNFIIIIIYFGFNLSNAWFSCSVLNIFGTQMYFLLIRFISLLFHFFSFSLFVAFHSPYAAKRVAELWDFGRHSFDYHQWQPDIRNQNEIISLYFVDKFASNLMFCFWLRRRWHFNLMFAANFSKSQ